MATLQKIRNNGKFLIGIVGIALFAFIAEEFVRSLSYTQAESRQRIGKIEGESVNYQDFNELVNEYANVIKFSNGISSLPDEQMAMVRDQVWSTYVNETLLGKECEKLGITVTDAELQSIINAGTNPMLAQTPFRSAQGTFDANALKQFLTQYNEIVNNPSIPAETKEQYSQMYDYWKFIEKSIRKQTLLEKYQALLGGTITSNALEAKNAYEENSNESNIAMAVLPYSSIKDTEVTVEDSDLKAKYNEMKQLFENKVETRDIKYIDIEVVASEEDEAALQKEMEGYAEALKNGADAAKTVREAASMIPYSALPVSAASLPNDVKDRLDSLTVGQQSETYRNAADNTINIVRLLSKVNRPDSVELRQIAVPGIDMASAEKTADSIMTVLNAGENFDSIAKKFDQPAAKIWLTSEQYEGMTIDENNRKFIETVTTAQVNAYNKIVLDGQGIIIAQVTAQRNFIDKYNVAVIKRTIDFSKDTYGKAYNDFSSFLAGNPTAEEIEAHAAEAGYSLQSRQAVSNIEHYVANVSNTRDAMRWIFNEDTKVGDVSPLYECGENNHMLVVILTGIHDKGYLEWNDSQVKEFLTTQVIRDKKAVMLQEKMKDAKSIAEITNLEGAVSDTINHVSFANNAFISKVGSSEPALSGAVSACKKGDFKAGVKGNAGVFAFQVLGKHTHSTGFDEKKEISQAAQSYKRIVNSFSSELYQKAEIEDNRYLFY